MWPTWRPRATSIVRFLAWGQPIPVYGDGQNLRGWLYVEDHWPALERILSQGEPGSTYCIGGRSEVANIDLVTMLFALMDELGWAPQVNVHEGLRRKVEWYFTHQGWWVPLFKREAH